MMQQIKRALRYCQARRHVTRDTTILQFSLYTGLRAKELAALRISDVYDAEGAVRTQFTLSKSQTKGSRARTVFINKQLAQQIAVYRKWRCCTDAAAPLFRSQKGGHFSANTMCQLFLDIFHACGLQGASSTVEDAHSSHAWLTRALVCVCLQHWLGIQVLPSHNSTLT